MTDTGSELLSRKQFLAKIGISDSGERRGRTGERDWPPHLLVGQKVYYRRAAVDDWILRQEAICNSGPPEVGAEPIDNVAAPTTQPHVDGLGDSAFPPNTKQGPSLETLPQSGDSDE
ncbi:hypothetical protein MYCOZU2_03898 [Mycobacterium intracellulare subsp. chimaera]|uniref:Uncharacterized protein n=1 Tax=Mycobacterium intracellulare subsp. chimaera TaxID=222805 RepID=A0A7U5MMI2_MYCIT|nr:hypothetical protein MYCOZU2_03898 [Mycobacterium intracellulare subsp. chimaera]